MHFSGRLPAQSLQAMLRILEELQAPQVLEPLPGFLPRGISPAPWRSWRLGGKIEENYLFKQLSARSK
jgi:hypothetical protein